MVHGEPATPRAVRSPWLAIAAGGLLAAIWLVLHTSPPPMEGGGRQFFGLWRTRHVAVGLLLVAAGAAFAFPRTDRRVRRRAGAAALGLLGAWILLEILGATLISWPEVFAGSELSQMGTVAVPHLDVRGVAHEDLATSWGYATTPIPFRFRTDGRGFRNEVDRDAADVYLVGDSILVAGLLPWEATLAAQLEQRLGRPVMNVALVGLSPQAERKLLVESGLPLRGRLVLHFLFEGNDLLDSRSWRLRRADSAADPGPTRGLLIQELVVKLQKLTQPHPAYAAAHTGRIGGEDYLFGWLEPSFRGLEDELPEIAGSLEGFRRDVETAGGEYAVVLVPATIRVLGPLCTFAPGSDLADYRRHCGPLPEYLRGWAERSGTPYLDLTPALEESARHGAIPWFRGDTHWNATGHRVAAEAIAGWSFVRERTRATADR